MAPEELGTKAVSFESWTAACLCSLAQFFLPCLSTFGSLQRKTFICTECLSQTWVKVSNPISLVLSHLGDNMEEFVPLDTALRAHHPSFAIGSLSKDFFFGLLDSK